MRFALDYAWASNKEEFARADVYAANFEFTNRSLHVSSLSCPGSTASQTFTRTPANLIILSGGGLPRSGCVMSW
jgi:hypothetical protein